MCPKSLKIEFLLTPGCTAAGPAPRLLRTVLAEERCDCPVRMRVITAENDAARLRFHGSPTILIDGVDIEGRSRGFFGHHPSCRIYRLHGELPGVPAREVIRRALYTHPAKRTAAASSSADG